MKGKTESFDDARGWSSHVLLSFKIWVFVREDASYVRSMILICDEQVVLQTRMFWLKAVKGRSLILACSRLSDFVFAHSQFSGPNYLGAWNRLHLLRPLSVIDL